MRTLLVAILVVAIIPVLSDLRLAYEGYLFPVVGELEITKAQSGYKTTKITGSAHKYRSCGHKKTLWFLGDRDGIRDPVVVVHNDKPQVRKTGNLYWGDIEVHLDKASVLTNSHADVVHECTILGFKRDVVSRFYTSP